MDNSHIIIIDELIKRFPIGGGEFTALNGINLKIGKGEFVGMVGPRDSVIGVKKENIIERFLKLMPQRFLVANDDYLINAVLIDIDEKDGRANNIKRINSVIESD